MDLGEIRSPKLFLLNFSNLIAVRKTFQGFELDICNVE